MTKQFLLAGLRLYQLVFSPLLRCLPLTPPQCRFEPSCSEFARQAITLHGARRGAALTARRLSRCHPFCCGGHDPVPKA